MNPEHMLFKDYHYINTINSEGICHKSFHTLYNNEQQNIMSVGVTKANSNTTMTLLSFLFYF